jgi:CheY-like chemotaxis protein
MDMEPVALLVGLDGSTAARLEPVLHLLELSGEASPTGGAAVQEISHRRLRLAVCQYPLPDMTMAELVRNLRRKGAPCRDTPLLVLTLPDLQEEARLQVSRGPFRVGSLQEPVSALRALSTQLLRLAPRRLVEASARLAPDGGGHGEVEGRVVNLSLSGMLLAIPTMLPVQTQCRFDLRLSQDTVSGTAEVVRHARPRRERVAGFAVRFLSLDPPGLETLRARLQIPG